MSLALIVAGSVGLWLVWRWQSMKAIKAIPGFTHPFVERIWLATVGVAFLAMMGDSIFAFEHVSWWQEIIGVARPLVVFYVFGLPGILFLV